MTLDRYLLGCALLGCALAPLIIGARSLRRQLLADWSGPPSWLADSVLVLAMLVAVMQVLGIVGVFRLVPTVIAIAAGGLLLLAVSRRLDARRAAAAPPAPAVGRPARMVAACAVAVVVADWCGRVAGAVAKGMTTPDTLWYHLPQAARFVQEGSITGLHFVDGDPLTAYYPSTASLFHSLGMMLFDRDLLSLIVNVGWLALALLAGWAIGRPWGVGPATLLAVAVVLATPTAVALEPAGAYSDVPGLALFVTAVALIIHAQGRMTPIVLAGLAAGLALGVKLTLIPPVIALTVVIAVLAPAGRRWRTAGAWLVLLAAAGGFWYVRNIVAAGSPFPPADLSLGPLSLPHVELASPSSSLVEYVTDWNSWREIFLPGLLQTLGPVWWALLALAAGGMVAAVVRGREPLIRMVGGLGIACGLGYLVQPQTLGVENIPFLFAANVRYALVALALGLIALALVPALRSGHRQWLVLGTLGAVLLVNQLDPAIWPTGLRDNPFFPPASEAASVEGLAVGALVLVAGVGAVSWRTRLSTANMRLAAALVTTAVVAAGWGTQHVYLRDRYKSHYLPATYRWAEGVRDTRIGIVGFFLQYPLYGRDISNYVQYVGTRRAHGDFSEVATCASWKRAINRGRYEYVVIAPPDFPISSRPEGREVGWTRADPAARQVLVEKASGVRVVVFRIDGPLDDRSCDAPATASVYPTGLSPADPGNQTMVARARSRWMVAQSESDGRSGGRATLI